MRTPYLLSLGIRLQAGLQRYPADFRARHARFIRSRQLADGGFSGRDVDLEGRPLFEEGIQADLYYTSFAVRGLAALSEFDVVTGERVATWLQQNAGSPASIIDVLSWLSCAIAVQAATGTDCLQDAPPDWPERLAELLESFRHTDGGYAKVQGGTSGSTYHSFLAALCYDVIGRPQPQPSQLVDFLRGRQREDGGFVEMEAMTRSGTNPTAAGIAALSIFDAITSEIRRRTLHFLEDVRSDDGGFQANTRIPFGDTLSTFTGYLTAVDLGAPEVIPARRLKRFHDELERRDEGGFLAAAWDHTPDVEYTFYALGTLALLESDA